MDCKKQSGKKGYVFTLDVLLAVFIFIYFAGFLFVIQQESDTSLLTFTHNFAEMLDTSKAVEKQITAAQNIQLILNNTPAQYCVNIQIYQYTSNTALHNVTKGGCSFTLTHNVQAYRTVYVSSLNELYVFRTGVWLK
jgi:hypothetical protein